MRSRGRRARQGGHNPSILFHVRLDLQYGITAARLAAARERPGEIVGVLDAISGFSSRASTLAAPGNSLM